MILAEGNVSGLATPETMFVKASGTSMAAATQKDLVEVRVAPLLALLDDETADDGTVARVLMESLVDSEDKRPSVEALLHAVCQKYAKTPVVAHTHPVSVNALLCSDQAVELDYAEMYISAISAGLAAGRVEAGRVAFVSHSRVPLLPET